MCNFIMKTCSILNTIQHTIVGLIYSYINDIPQIDMASLMKNNVAHYLSSCYLQTGKYHFERPELVINEFNLNI